MDTISDKEDIKIKKTKEVLPNTSGIRSMATKEANKSKTMESSKRGTNVHDPIMFSKSPDEVDPAPLRSLEGGGVRRGRRGGTMPPES